MDEDISIQAYPERPIKSPHQDRLFRSRFVQRLVNAVISHDRGKSSGVVVGITGPWGSGKSSILNLLHDQILQEHPNCIVVRFDPWLVSGRDNIINQFFAELIGSINNASANKKLKSQLSRVLETITDYGANLAPVSDLAAPGFGALLKTGVGVFRTALASRKSLYHLRKKVTDELALISVPIVVMIDELDRVEDDEVKAIAQLVRAVADFPNISYVLAYDQARVFRLWGEMEAMRLTGARI